MNFFRNLEYKYGKYAIRNLMYYIIMMYLAGILLNLINPMFYYLYLSLLLSYNKFYRDARYENMEI